MKVLVITPWFPSPDAPGSGIFNYRDVQLLARDHQVTVLHITDIPTQRTEQSESGSAYPFIVKRIPYQASDRQSVRSAMKLVREAAQHVDIIHSMAAPALPVAAGVKKKTWVHTEHASSLITNQASSRVAMMSALLPLSIRAGLGVNWYRTLLSRPQVVVAVGPGLASVVSQVRAGETRVIGNYVQTPTSVIDRPEMHSGDSIHMAAVGNLIPTKGPQHALACVANLHERGVHASLTWAGTGPMQAALIDEVQELGLAEYVNFVGFVPSTEIPALLSAADLFILPTAGETFGVAIAEALACGVPVVTSGSGGHLDYLDPSASRHVFNPSGALLAEAVIDLMGDPLRMPRAQIRSQASTRFSEDARQTAYREVYELARSGAAS